MLDRWSEAWAVYKLRLTAQNNLMRCLAWRSDKGTPCRQCGHWTRVHGLNGCYHNIELSGMFCPCTEQGTYNPEWQDRYSEKIVMKEMEWTS